MTNFINSKHPLVDILLINTLFFSVYDNHFTISFGNKRLNATSGIERKRMVKKKLI